MQIYAYNIENEKIYGKSNFIMNYVFKYYNKILYIDDDHRDALSFYSYLQSNKENECIRNDEYDIVNINNDIKYYFNKQIKNPYFGGINNEIFDSILNIMI